MKIIDNDGTELEFDRYIFYGFEKDGTTTSSINCTTSEVTCAKSELECKLFEAYLKKQNKKAGIKNE